MNRNRDLKLVYAISFMDLFAIGLTFPLLSNHLRDLGASHFTIGLLHSLYSGLQVISGPVIGSWSDIRDRKSVLIVTLLISSLCYVLLGLTSSVFFIAVLRFILGITKHTQSLCKAIITDILPAQERAGAFGNSAAFSSLGFIVGPLLGGHLSEFNNGFSYVCFITGFLFLINIILASVITNNTRKNVPRRNHSILTNVKEEFYKSIFDIGDINWSDFWDCFLLRFVFGFCITMYFTQQPNYLRERFEFSQRHIGYTISFFSFFGTVSAFLLHYINNFFYRNDESCLRRLNHFFILMTVSSVCLYLAPNFQIFLAVSVPFSFCCTILRIVSMELMLKKAENHRGSLSGTSNSIMSMARFVTPVTSGILTDRFGSSWTMLFSSVPPLLGTALTFRMKWKDGKKLKTQ